ncbi:MAG: hypothetical protein Q4A79_02565 [Candidatus Saccharibacteria bacterium]|nr:hypothetical protein [Candidatus Saccharibacteria bacterium]
MADYVLARKSRNMISDITHVFLNILLGILVVLITVFSASPLIGGLFVIVSKWRVFAVRPRYMLSNLKASLVDFIVGFSVVALAYFAGGSLLTVHFLLMTIYVVWLVFVKPRSSEMATFLQSLIAVFLGISAVMIATSGQNAIIVTFLAFLIGYAASRHILIQTNDKDFTLMTLVLGLVFAEIAWLSQIWSIIYTFGGTGIRIPQAAIILTIFMLVYNYARQARQKFREDFRFRNIAGPVFFGFILVWIIIIWFSDPIFNI